MKQKKNNSELIAIRNQINTETKEGAEALAEINAKLDENTEFIKANISASEQQKATIGDYKNQVKGAFAELNIFNGGLGGFVERSQAAGGSGALLKNAFNEMKTGIIGTTKATLSFIATPIGAVLAAIVLAFALVKNAMDRSEESTQKITKIFTVFSGITNKLLKYLEPLGEYLIDGIVKGFELAGKAAEKSLDLISSGLKMIGFDSASESVKGFKNEMVNATKESIALANAEAKLTTQQRTAERVQLEYQKRAEKLRQTRDDENLSIKERIAANTELGKVLKEQLREELKIAQTALEVANLRIKAEGKNKETLDAQAEALTKITDIQERITGQESEQLANLNSLRKEAADKEKERIDKIKEAKEKAIESESKRQDASIQKMNEELALYIAKEKQKQKSMIETIDFETKIMDKSIAILQKQYASQKISKLKFDEEIIKATQDRDDKILQLTLNRSKAELDLFISDNVSKLDNSKLLTQSMIDEEKERLDAIRIGKLNLLEDEKKTNQEIIDAKRLNNEELSIADMEYLTQKNILEEEFRNQNQTNQKAFDDQIKQQKAEQLIADREIELANAATKFEEDNILIQQQYDAEVALLNDKLAKQEITQAQFDAKMILADKKKKDLLRLAELNDTKSKLEEFQKIGVGLQELFGKNKVIASALAGINTALGVTEILKTPSVLPEPLASISRAVQIGTTIATGAKSIAEINGAKFEKGGLMEIGGKRHSQGGTKFVGEDGTRFEAEQGELIAVVNRNTASFLMGMNEKFGNSGASVTSRPNYFAMGGVVSRNLSQPQSISVQSTPIDYDLLASKIGANVAIANASLPNPVVAVTDINYQQESYAQVVNGANIF